MDEEWIAGINPVLEALRAGRTIHKIWIAEQTRGKQMQPIIAEAKRLGIVVQSAERKKLDQISGDVRNQGVIAQVAAYRYAELDELLAKAAQSGRPPAILLLDELEDPHNLGSILRTAECAGMHGVVIPKRRAVGLTPAVAKISAGAVEHVPVARAGNLAQTIDRLKERGLWIAGAAAAGGQTLYDADFTVPLAILIGNEHRGLGRLVKEKCDFLVTLPMLGQINSLNASMAAGILMFEVVRQRMART
ncbi:MAG TPA: 23S rRNA (guanosine(2251)-2'-O)-methyltransferase RlmB [Bacilli bacterium]